MPSRPTLRQFAIGAAWFFIVISLAHLVFAVGVKFSEPSGTFKMYHAVVGDHSYDALGLTYTGVLGLLLAMLQTLVVATAAVASILPWPRTLRWRRIGHVVLTSWVGLWALNFIWLAGVDPTMESFAQTAVACLLAGCTGYRGLVGWSPGCSTNLHDGPRDGEASGMPLGPTDETADSRVSRKSLPEVFRRGRSLVKNAIPVVRRKMSVGLYRVAEVARRQAERVAPNTAE